MGDPAAYANADRHPTATSPSKPPFIAPGYIRARDPSRPIHYEGGGFMTPATDIICPMYARVSHIEAFAAAAPDSERRPGILCEYAHSMGNSTGNFREYWDCFERLPLTQGRL